MSEVSLALKDTREKILRLEDEMRSHPQVHTPLRHFFIDGVYAREMFIPKGTTITGKIHKFWQISILSYGVITVINDEGEPVTIQAPFTYVAPPGTKRCCYAHTDVVWTTICKNTSNEQDLQKLESNLIAETFADVPRITTETVAQLKE